jgi:TfoX/Sxy family transcriptional regulator of competence genes
VFTKEKIHPMVMTFTPTKENFLNYVLSQLTAVDHLSFRKQAGGIGFFHNNLLFGAIVGGRLRLRAPKVCLQTQQEPAYLFADWAKEYCEVPNEIVDDQKRLMNWVDMAIQLAENAEKKG